MAKALVVNKICQRQFIIKNNNKLIRSFTKKIKYIKPGNYCKKNLKFNILINPIKLLVNNYNYKEQSLNLKVNYKIEPLIMDVPIEYNSFIKTEEVSLIVKQSKDKNNKVMNIKCKPCSINVDDLIPSNKSNNSGNIKSFKFVLQKQSFSEIDLEFTSGKIISAEGLPAEMKLINQKIKGTPIYSGTYNCILHLDNGNKINILIIISNLDRKL